MRTVQAACSSAGRRIMSRACGGSVTATNTTASVESSRA
ncbi:hypothetical protein ATSB10_25980 [Dyella thiooxydans]|uniref:Uncharacterized protein n=1 Tax=Dyella thiooxydans TaxID=445710 RepID=A0A160N3R8_9GAMM|nr:hypothetical protein ATSB10_25980 [Dyella thiooxydans]